MKLYVYDHCPYCVKARMIFGLKNIDFTLIFVLNDEEKMLVDLIGKKIVPILIKDDKSVMAESMDIVHYVDESDHKTIIKGKSNPKIKSWLADVMNDFSILTIAFYPLVPFSEFKTTFAVDWFIQRMETKLGVNLSDIRDNEAEYLARINSFLIQLPALIITENAVNGELSDDDFHLYACLRNLTLIRGINFPNKVLNYMQTMEKLTKVPLLFTYAV